MSTGRLLLHALRLALAVLLAMQLLTVVAVLRQLDPDALHVSAFLPAALLLKAVLVLGNAGLLWWVHRRLSRGTRAAPTAPVPRPDP